MIGRTSILILSFFLTFSPFAQTERTLTDHISTCDGAQIILHPGTFEYKFAGKNDSENKLGIYPSLASMNSSNLIWCSFIAPFDGRLSLEAGISSGALQMIVFEPHGSDDCAEIFNGNAEIKRIISKPEPIVGLNLNVNTGFLYPLDLLKGTKVLLLFANDSPNKDLLKLKLNFEALSNDAQDVSENSKVIDKRSDPYTPPLNIMVRDAETGAPVITDIVVEGESGISGFYRASDLFFVVMKSGQITVKCDAEGYFFSDRVEPVSTDIEHELVIWLEPLGQGKSFQIEEIEFQPGTSEFMPGANSKLKRLKEFLVLNDQVKIEIEGHVFSRGENTLIAKKLSEARAKQVYKYLVENGIDKNRLSTVGYGNTKPIYPEPKFAYEEQANRRVEIKVL